MKIAVVAFGRMSGISVGHKKLVDKVVSLAKKNGAKPLVFLSQTYDKKKNPLPYDRKLQYAKKAFGNVIQKSPANVKTVINVLQFLDGKYDKIIFVAGSDRVPQYEKLLQQYNGKEYNFESIEILSAGDRDPDADGVSGISASKLRDMAKSGDLENFKKNAPLNAKDAESMYNDIRKGMGLSESFFSFKSFKEFFLG